MLYFLSSFLIPTKLLILTPAFSVSEIYSLRIFILTIPIRHSSLPLYYICANLYPVRPPILPSLSLHIIPYYSNVTLSHVASCYVLMYTSVNVSKTSGATNISLLGNTLTTQTVYYSVLRLSVQPHLSLEISRKT
jgi:hypothetical protein